MRRQGFKMRKQQMIDFISSHRRPLLCCFILTVICVWLSCSLFNIESRAINTTLLPQYEQGSPKDLLLLSYMRSGSTLTGELLRDSPRTFFVFEPLIPLAPYHYFSEGCVCKMRDTNCSTDKAEVRIKEAIDTVHNIFSCNIRAVPKVVIDEILKQNKSGQAWYRYGLCLKRNKYEKNRSIAEKCLVDIENDCKNADTRVSKILRLGFQSAEKLLQKLPRLNILLLFRDPRGIVNSRIKTHWFPVKENETEVVHNNINSLCTKMQNDWHTFGKSKWLPRTRITLKKIEDLISDNKMLDIFEYINKNVTTEDANRIQAITKQKKNLFRDWVSEIRTDYRMQTEVKCKSILKFYGYT